MFNVAEDESFITAEVVSEITTTVVKQSLTYDHDVNSEVAVLLMLKQLDAS